MPWLRDRVPSSVGPMTRQKAEDRHGWITREVQATARANAAQNATRQEPRLNAAPNSVMTGPSSVRSDFGYLHLMVGILTLNVVVLIPEIPLMTLAHSDNRGTQIPAANAIVVRLQRLSIRVRSRERI